MLIYTTILSVMMLGMLTLMSVGTNGFDKGSPQQEALGQIIASNVRTPAACGTYLNLVYDNNQSFNASSAGSSTGQAVKVRIPQFQPGKDISGNTDEVYQGIHVSPFNLDVDSIDISNARQLGTSGAITTYHAVLSVGVSKPGSLFHTSFKRKPVIYISFDVNTSNGNKVSNCREDNSDVALCSRYGGVYNAALNPKCSSVPPNQMCPQNQLLQGVDAAGNVICTSVFQSCPAGQFMSGFSPQGQIVCQALPATNTASTTPTTIPTSGPSTQAKPAAGVWKQVSSAPDLPCPAGETTTYMYMSMADGNGVEGLSCYGIGYQCHEVICGGATPPYNTAPFTETYMGNGSPPYSCNVYGAFIYGPPKSDKYLECQPGAPTRGSIKTVPDPTITSGTTRAGTTADSSLPVCTFNYDVNDLFNMNPLCSYLGEQCQSPYVNSATGFPDVYTCDKIKPTPSFGILAYSRTLSLSMPSSCSPEYLDMADPQFKDWYWNGSTAFPLWCQYFAAKSAVGGLRFCVNDTSGNPMGLGLTCDNKGNDVCASYDSSNSSILKVYSCQ